jgi:hypothetical protein
MQLVGVAYYAIVGVGGWRLVRGHGQGWRFLIWMALLFGPFGLVVGLLARRGARLGEASAASASATETER